VSEKPPPKLPRREATPGQALIAIALVFFLGVAIGFVLAKTL
jgi:hypothetical protein